MKRQSKTDRLKERIVKMRDIHERRRLRDLYGGRYIESINSIMGKSLSLDDFNNDFVAPLSLNWARNLADSEGLVAAYIGKIDAIRILNCIRDVLCVFNGMIGFHEKSYLGFAHLDQIDPLLLLKVAEFTKDSVVFYNNSPEGVIMVDCYLSQPGEPFSIIVQGDRLISDLRGCFVSQTGT
jgi:hypothetical protein